MAGGLPACIRQGIGPAITQGCSQMGSMSDPLNSGIGDAT